MAWYLVKHRDFVLPFYIYFVRTMYDKVKTDKQPAEDRVQWREFMSTVMNLRFP